MAVVKRDDGLYDVQDEYGGTAIEGIPGEWVPEQQSAEAYDAVMTPDEADRAIAAPASAEPLPPASAGLYANIDRAPPEPIAMTQGVSGPGVPQTMVYNPPQPESPAPQIKEVLPFGTKIAPQDMVAPGDKPSASLLGSASPVQAMGGGNAELSPAAQSKLGGIIQQKATGTTGSYQKPGWQPQSSMVERPTPLSPEQKSEYEGAKSELFKAQEAEAKAAEGTGDVEGAYQIQSANLYAEKAQQASADWAEHKAKAFDREQRVNARMGVLDNRLEQLRSKRAQFDPDKYWTDKGAFGTFLAKIGIALGAVGQGILGLKSNPIQDQVNQEIDRAIDAQKTELEFLGDDVGQEYNVLGQMRANFADQESAELATRAIYGEMMASQIEELGASAGSMKAQQAAKQAAAQIRAKNAATRLQIVDQQRGVEQRKDVYSRGGMVGGQRPDPLGAIKAGMDAGLTLSQTMEGINRGYIPNATGGWTKMDEAQRKQLEYANNMSVRLPDGSYAYAPDQPYAEKARGIIQDARILKHNYARQLEILDQVGHGLPWADAQAEYAALVGRNRVIWKKKSSDDLGVIAGPDLQILDSYSGAGGEEVKSLDSKTKARIRAGLDAVDQNVETTFWELHKDPYRSEAILQSQPAGQSAAIQEVKR